MKAQTVTPRDAKSRLIVALDVSTAAAAKKLVAAAGDSAGMFKVGKQLFTAEGPQLVRYLVASAAEGGAGVKVFLDLKFHDIPNTVGAAVAEAGKLGATMVTVHASGGSKMLRAAAEAAKPYPGLTVLAVTVLTSMAQQDLAEIGYCADDGGAITVEAQVLRLAGLALRAGCGGIVASAHEAAAIRQRFGTGFGGFDGFDGFGDFAIVTPGVRPSGTAAGDQSRVVTPAQAIAAGATHIVVGRPITEASDPAAAARAIVVEMANF